MKLDWTMVMSLVIALAIFKLLDELVLDKAVDKIAGTFESNS